MAIQQASRPVSPVMRIIVNWGGTAVGLATAALLLLRLSAM